MDDFKKVVGGSRLKFKMMSKDDFEKKAEGTITVPAQLFSFNRDDSMTISINQKFIAGLHYAVNLFGNVLFGTGMDGEFTIVEFV